MLLLKAVLLVFREVLTSSTITWANNSCLRIWGGKLLGLTPASLMAELVLLLGVLGAVVAAVGSGPVGVRFFALCLLALWSRFSSIHVFRCNLLFSLSRLLIFLFAFEIPRLILFLVLTRFDAALKSILITTRPFCWILEEHPASSSASSTPF